MSAPGEEKLVFKQTLDALYLRALKGRLDEATIARLKAIGLDLKKDLLPGYPFETFRQAIGITLTHLYGPTPTREQLREFGKVWTDGFFETFMGVALIGVLKLIGPRRSMLRSAQNYRNINNYADARVNELAPNHFELLLADGYDWPEISVGSLQRSVELTGAKNVVTRYARREGAHNVYDVTWE